MSHPLRNKPSLYINSIELVPAVHSNKSSIFHRCNNCKRAQLNLSKSRTFRAFWGPHIPIYWWELGKITSQRQRLGHWQGSCWAMWGLGIWHTKLHLSMTSVHRCAWRTAISAMLWSCGPGCSPAAHPMGLRLLWETDVLGGGKAHWKELFFL